MAAANRNLVLLLGGMPLQACQPDFTDNQSFLDWCELMDIPIILPIGMCESILLHIFTTLLPKLLDTRCVLGVLCQ